MSSTDVDGQARSGGGELLQQEEMMRLNELWQHTKTELTAKVHELAEVERTHAATMEQLQAEHSNGMREMQSICLELRDKSRHLEAQLQAARDENLRLSDLVEGAQRKARDADVRTQEHLDVARSREQQAGELQQALRALQRERKDVIDRSFSETRRLEDQLASRERAVANLEARVRQAEADVAAAQNEYQSAVEREEGERRRFEDSDHANRELSKQVAAGREQMKFLQVSRRNEQQLHAIADQLQRDNARLVRILSATTEFAEFVDYAADSAGLSYVAPSASVDLAASLRARADDDSFDVRGVAYEAELWAPSDVYTLANEFRHQHAPGVAPEAFADMLLKINSVWRQREQRHISRLKKRFQEERKALQRRAQHAQPYDLVVQEAEVERLKKELRAVRMSAGSGRRRLNETEANLLESSLSAVEALSAQVSAYRDKEEMLRVDGRESEDVSPTGLYSEGAASASRTAADMVDVLGHKIGDLVRDFQQRTVALSRDDPEFYIKVIRLQGWFLENLEKRVNACRDRVRNLAFELQSAVTSSPNGQRSHAHRDDDGDSYPRDSLPRRTACTASDADQRQP